jgi:hypothetical protein
MYNLPTYYLLVPILLITYYLGYILIIYYVHSLPNKLITYPHLINWFFNIAN